MTRSSKNPCNNEQLAVKLLDFSVKHKGLEDFFYTGNKKGVRPEHAKRLARILDRLNAASEIKDMNYPGSLMKEELLHRYGFALITRL